MENTEFKFLGYKVSKVNLNIKTGFGTGKESLKYTVDIKNNFNKENKRFVEAVLIINIAAKSNNLNMMVEIKGGFIADAKMPQKTFTILCSQNAPAILYPFARSIISTYTTQANIPPIMLPIMNFIKKKLSLKKLKKE